MPVNVTYVVIEGTTDTDNEIKEMMSKIESSLKCQFSPRKVIITISEPLSDEEDSDILPSIGSFPMKPESPTGYS
jgi:hypothetical protein